MAKFESLSDLAFKIDYEGGIWEALEYGIYADDVPDEIASEWEVLTKAFSSVENYYRTEISPILEQAVEDYKCAD